MRKVLDWKGLLTHPAEWKRVWQHLAEITLKKCYLIFFCYENAMMEINDEI